jgi:hypothetical protein
MRNLDRYGALNEWIESLVYDPHGAASDAAFYFVLCYLCGSM